MDGEDDKIYGRNLKDQDIDPNAVEQDDWATLGAQIEHSDDEDDLLE